MGESQRSKVKSLASPKGECQKVNGESEDAEGGGVEQHPIGFDAEGDVAELVNLKKGKREGEKGRREDIERKVDSGHGKQKNISEQDEDMMQRHDAFPTEAREKGDTLIFLILRKGLEIKHDEISKREKRKRNC